MEKEFNWRTPVIAIDFDGCLAKESYPEIGTPNWEVINEAKRLQKGGACLILWTCRQGKPLEAAVEACRSWGLEFDAVNENPQFMIDLFGNDCRKVGADEYWDDRSVWMGEPGAFRNIRGASCRPIKRDEMRRFINHALRPEIEAIQEKKTPPAEHMDSYLQGIAILLKECLERLEGMTAIIDERNDAHDWYKNGYRDATENAAKWVTNTVKKFVQAAEKLGDVGTIPKDRKKAYVIQLLESKGIVVTSEIDALIESAVLELDNAVGEIVGVLADEADSE